MNPYAVIILAVLAYWLLCWCLPASISMYRETRGERLAKAAHPCHGTARVRVGGGR